MNEIPRFMIMHQIGHGQFSNVYKAKWINAPLTPSYPSPELPDANQHNHHYCHEQANLVDQPFADQPSNDSHQHHHHGQQLQAQQFDQQHRTASSNRSLDSQSLNGKNLANDRATETKVCTEKFVALKRIKYYGLANSKLRMDCMKEVRLLQQLKHPNIINYSVSFIERNELFIVLELADGGDLSKLIQYFQRREQLLSERIILKYFTQVCSAVKYIHSKRILHRDIKPANIFMTSDGCVKLGDFGLGRFFSQNTRDAHTIVGTFFYMSPERISESGYGFSSDIWSLGCVLYELITLNSPFSIPPLEQQQNRHQQKQHPTSHRSQQLTMQPQPQQLVSPNPQQQQQQNPYNLKWLFERILRADYPSLARYTNISPRLRHLVTECLQPNPDARPDMEYICAVVDQAYLIQLPSNSSSSSSANSSTCPSPCSSKQTAVSCQQ